MYHSESILSMLNESWQRYCHKHVKYFEGVFATVWTPKNAKESISISFKSILQQVQSLYDQKGNSPSYMPQKQQIGKSRLCSHINETQVKYGLGSYQHSRLQYLPIAQLLNKAFIRRFPEIKAGIATFFGCFIIPVTSCCNVSARSENSISGL